MVHSNNRVLCLLGLIIPMTLMPAQTGMAPTYNLHDQTASLTKYGVFAGVLGLGGFIIWQCYTKKQKNYTPSVAVQKKEVHDQSHMKQGASSKKNASQIFHVTVCQQKGNTCGANAVSNGIIYYHYLTRAAEFNGLSQQQADQRLEERLASSKDSRDSDWRDDRIQQELDARLKRSANFTVIRSIDQFHPNILEDRDNFLRAVINLRHVPGTKHIFIIGNMNEYQSLFGYRGSYGHWIAVVVSRTEDHLDYYVMDSLDKNRNDWVEKLQHSLERDELTTLQFQCLENEVAAAETILTNAELRSPLASRLHSVLARLERLVLFVADFKLIDEKEFDTYRKRILALLLEINNRATAANILYQFQDRIEVLRCSYQKDPETVESKKS